MAPIVADGGRLNSVLPTDQEEGREQTALIQDLPVTGHPDRYSHLVAGVTKGKCSI